VLDRQVTAQSLRIIVMVQILCNGLKVNKLFRFAFLKYMLVKEMSQKIKSIIENQEKLVDWKKGVTMEIGDYITYLWIHP
jgi:hypothetical protein